MKKDFVRLTIILLTFFALSFPANGQQKDITREQYIATYAPLAIQQQKTYGIPASIKMAQGILESRYGNSDLSRRSNNHFGIKCKSYWKGDTVVYDDDELGECFRRYSSVEESYCDHSEFLKNGTRYASLFELPATDYKAWAHGLKKAGYATAPHYAGSLIKCIEDYELYLLDEGIYPTYLAGVQPVALISIPVPNYKAVQYVDADNYMVSVFSAGGHGVFYRDGSRYIIARNGDSFDSIAKALGVREKKLLKYNRKNKGALLTEGDIVYIENRRNNRKA